MVSYETKRDRTQKLVLTALFAALIAAGAFMRLQIFAIPFTMQMCMVNMAGLLLGGFYGGLSVLIYVLIGLIGVPIFAQGGGIMYVLNPTFGYLVGMIVGCTLCGYIAHSKGTISYGKMIVGTLVMFVTVYFFGLLHFYLVETFYFATPVSAYTLFVSSMLVFLPSDTITCTISILIVKKLIPILERQGYRVASEWYIKRNVHGDTTSINCNSIEADSENTANDNINDDKK